MCPNSACKRYAIEWPIYDDKLCSECGSALKEVEIEEEVDAVDPWTLVEELDSGMVQPFGECDIELSYDMGIHIWIGNHDTKEAERCFYISQDEESVTDVQMADIEAELKDFPQSYAKELSKLRDVYGDNNVTIKWGIIHAVYLP
jgi:hypothetical protein